MNKKIVALILALSFVISCFTACGNNAAGNEGGENSSNTINNAQNGGDASAEPQPAAEQKTLYFGLTGDPVTLDPHMKFDQNAQIMYWNMYSRLVWRDEDNNMHPELAESWSWNDDYTQLTMKLREGVTFHNGEALTSEDVEYSLERGTDNVLIGFFPNYDHVEIIDDYNFIIHYTQPTPGAFDYLTMPCVSIVDKDYTEANDINAAPNGTGPYKFVERASGDYIKLTAFDDYWEGEPVIKDVVFKIAVDTDAAIVALETGELSCLSHAPLAYKSYVESSDALEWYSKPMSAMTWLRFQLGGEEFTRYHNEDLRIALSYAMDRDAIVAGALDGAGSPEYSVFLPGMSCYDPDYRIYEHDVEKAKEYLEKAGYPDGLTQSVYVAEQVDQTRPAEVLQASYAEAGIDLELNIVARSYWLSVGDSRQFDFLIGAPNLVMMHCPNALASWFHSDALDGGLNSQNLNDPKVDELLDAGFAETDPEKQNAIYEELNEYMTTHCYLTTMYTREAALIGVSDLGGCVPSDCYRYRVYEMYWK